MDAVLYAVCAASGWVVFVYTLRLQRRQPSPARRAICVSFGAFAPGITLAIPPVAAAVDTLAGVPNLAKVLSHGCAMTIAAAAEIMLLFLAVPDAARRRARRWIAVTSLAFTAMVALFAWTARYDPPVRLTVEYARDPAVSAYLMVFMAIGFGGYCVDITRLCWRFAGGLRNRPWLRRGLRTTAVGSVFAMLYIANKIVFLVAYWTGRDPGGERQIAAVLVTISALLMMTGLTMPAWGPALTVLPRWRRVRAYRRLRPLWKDLVAATPELELDHNLRKPLVVLRDAEYALTRRFTEILDGRLALRAYLDHRATDTAIRYADRAGLTGDERQAVIDAAQLAYAVRAQRAGARAAAPDTAEMHRPDGGFAGEIAWLERVARAYTGSPVVAAVLAATAHLPADGDALATTLGDAR